MVFDGLPFIIGWELTLACNLRCNHCGSAAGTPRTNELTLEESIQICEQFPELMVQEVNFTGGEPLLHKHWKKIANHLRGLGISSKFLTNGLTLNHDIIEDLKEVAVDGVGISLDGLESTHNYIRGCPGLFQKVMNSIRALKSAEIPITIITTVNALNLRELPTMFELLNSNGVKQWQVQPIFPLGRGEECSELHLNSAAYLEIEDFVRRYSTRSNHNGLVISPGDSLGYYTDFFNREPLWQGCPAGLMSCGITSNGKIKGCLSLPDELVEGDLRKNDLWDIWFDEESFEYTRHFSSDQVGENCQSCEHAELCKGGCSCMSYGLTGSFHNDPLCFKGIRVRNKD